MFSATCLCISAVTVSRTWLRVFSIKPYLGILPVLCAALYLAARLPPELLVVRCAVPISAHINTGFLSPCRLRCIPLSPFPFFPAFFVPIVTRKPALRLKTAARMPFSRSLSVRIELRRLATAFLRTSLASFRKPPLYACALRFGSNSANNRCKLPSSYSTVPLIAIRLLAHIPAFYSPCQR